MPIENLPGRHVHEFVGDAFHQLRLMRDHEDCLPLIANSSQHRSHLAGGMHVNVGKGLVQQHQLGIVQDGARQRQPLPHSLRVLTDTAPKIRIKADHQHRLAAHIVVVKAVKPGEIAEIFHAAQLVIQQRRVSHIADAMCHVANLFRAQKREAALAGLHQSGDNAQQRALPCPIVAEHHVKTAGGERR